MKLVYAYDALCGWCYGFSPVIQAFHQKYQEEYDSIEVLSGGMITGERVGPIGEVAAYIKDAYKTVEDRANVKFGEAFLQDILAEGSAIFTSYPAAIALSIVKKEKPQLALAFSAALQKAVYDEGIKPAENEAYAEVAAREVFGFDKADFQHKMELAEFRNDAEADFNSCYKYYGVSGFPTVFLVDEEHGNGVLLTRGYAPIEHLEKAYDVAKEQIIEMREK